MTYNIRSNDNRVKYVFLERPSEKKNEPDYFMYVRLRSKIGF